VMYALTAYAFHPSPPLTNKAEWQEVVRQRQQVTYMALFEDGRPVATAASSTLTQQVRGALFGAGGIWGVATAPGARRKGYSRRTLTELLSTLREAGQAVTCLYPFRESFYERLGYVTFALPLIARLTPSALRPLVEKDLGGQVDVVLIGDGFETYRDYLHRLRNRTHGMALFDHGDTHRAQRNNLWQACARVDGELVGVMLYELRGEEISRFDLRASRFYYDTSQGKYLLLQWLARHVDQAYRIEMWLPPFERPETWLADIEVKLESQVRAPMGRVLDVARIGGMQTGPGHFTASLSDPLCPWNEGNWLFETREGALHVSPSTTADCALTIQALSALVYGTHPPGDFAIRGWGSPSLAVQAVLQAMFPPLTPYLHEYF